MPISLSNAFASPTGLNSGSAGADTNTAAGTLYAVVQLESISNPTPTQVKNGNNGNGNPASGSDTKAISNAGTKSFSFSGLTKGTAYEVFFYHEDGSEQSGVASAVFVTDSDILEFTGNKNVVEEETGNPVEGATVYVTRPMVAEAPKTATTDANGEAVITGLEPGATYRCWAEKDINGDGEIETPEVRLRTP